MTAYAKKTSQKGEGIQCVLKVKQIAYQGWDWWQNPWHSTVTQPHPVMWQPLLLHSSWPFPGECSWTCCWTIHLAWNHIYTDTNSDDYGSLPPIVHWHSTQVLFMCIVWQMDTKNHQFHEQLSNNKLTIGHCHTRFQWCAIVHYTERVTLLSPIHSFTIQTYQYVSQYPEVLHMS